MIWINIYIYIYRADVSGCKGVTTVILVPWPTLCSCFPPCRTVVGCRWPESRTLFDFQSPIPGSGFLDSSFEGKNKLGRPDFDGELRGVRSRRPMVMPMLRGAVQSEKRQASAGSPRAKGFLQVWVVAINIQMMTSAFQIHDFWREADDAQIKLRHV